MTVNKVEVQDYLIEWDRLLPKLANVVYNKNEVCNMIYDAVFLWQAEYESFSPENIKYQLWMNRL